MGIERILRRGIGVLGSCGGFFEIERDPDKEIEFFAKGKWVFWRLEERSNLVFDEGLGFFGGV